MQRTLPLPLRLMLSGILHVTNIRKCYLLNLSSNRLPAWSGLNSLLKWLTRLKIPSKFPNIFLWPQLTRMQRTLPLPLRLMLSGILHVTNIRKCYLLNLSSNRLPAWSGLNSLLKWLTRLKIPSKFPNIFLWPQLTRMQKTLPLPLRQMLSRILHFCFLVILEKHLAFCSSCRRCRQRHS